MVQITPYLFLGLTLAATGSQAKPHGLGFIKRHKDRALQQEEHEEAQRVDYEARMLEERLKAITATTTMVTQMTETHTVWVKPTPDQATFVVGNPSGSAAGPGSSSGSPVSSASPSESSIMASASSSRPVVSSSAPSPHPSGSSAASGVESSSLPAPISAVASGSSSPTSSAAVEEETSMASSSAAASVSASGDGSSEVVMSSSAMITSRASPSPSGSGSGSHAPSPTRSMASKPPPLSAVASVSAEDESSAPASSMTSSGSSAPSPVRSSASGPIRSSPAPTSGSASASESASMEEVASSTVANSAVAVSSSASSISSGSSAPSPTRSSASGPPRSSPAPASSTKSGSSAPSPTRSSASGHPQSSPTTRPSTSSVNDDAVSSSAPASVSASRSMSMSMPASVSAASSSAPPASTTHATSVDGTIMAGYYPDWASWYLPPEKVDFSKFDVLDFAFALPTQDNDLQFTQDDSSDTLRRLVTAAHKAGKKVKLSIGGWTGSQFFSTIVSQDWSRRQFALNILKAYNEYNLDGVDFDWEYPGVQGAPENAVSGQDSANYMEFLQIVRWTLPPDALISLATQVWPFAGPDGNPLKDVSGFADIIDWILIMNYDIWGSSSTPGANAPLSDGCHNSTQPLANAYSAIASWTSAGMPANKITLGVPAYGYLQKSWATRLMDRSLPHKQNDARGIVTVYNDNGGDSDGQVMFESLISQGALVDDGNGGFQGAGGFFRVWDECSSTPFLKSWDSGQIITYDDPESMSLKGQFAAQAGLKGCNVFSVDGDWTGYSWPLTDAVRSGMGLS